MNLFVSAPDTSSGLGLLGQRWCMDRL